MGIRKVKRRKKPGCMSGSDWIRQRFDAKPVDVLSIPKITSATTPDELLQIALAQAKVRKAEEEHYKAIRDNLRRTKRAEAAARATQLSPATQEVPATPAEAVPSNTTNLNLKPTERRKLIWNAMN